MVDLRKITLGKTPDVVIKVSGNLHARSWDNADVGVMSYAENLIRVEKDDRELRILCASDCDLFLPEIAVLRVERVGGDAYIRDIKTKLIIQKVGGNLSIQNVPSLEIERIGGDCRLQSVHEGLIAQRISGDLRGDDIGGVINAEIVRGDVLMDGCSGIFNLQSSGNIRFSTAEESQGAFTLRAKGDIYLHVPPDISGSFEIETPSRDIAVSIGDTRQRVNEKQFAFIRGEGGVAVSLYASGDVVITDDEIDRTRLEEIFSRMDRHWDQVEREGERRFSGSVWGAEGFHSHLAAERAAERARLAAERIEKRAQKRVQFTLAKLDKEMPNIDKIVNGKMREVMNDLEARLQDFGEDIPVPPSPPRPHQPFSFSTQSPAKSGATDKERIMILQMVKDNKITPEQAVALLDALSGK